MATIQLYITDLTNVFDHMIINTNIVYGQALNNLGVSQDLTLDIFMPGNNRPVNPLIVFIHGGSLYTGCKEELTSYCAYFAERNFTAVTINYRLGWEISTTGNECDGNPESLKKAGYRAIQDCRAALRYLMAHALRYKIDPNHIFLAGESAGASTALATAYMNQADCDLFLSNASAELGLLDASGNHYNNRFSIKGIVNMWGGILDPSIIGPRQNIPVLSFHGTNDLVTPYNIGRFNNCTNYIEIYGSKAIYDLLLARNIGAVLHSDPNGGHGVYSFEYRAHNIYCFASRLLHNEVISGSYTDFTDNYPAVMSAILEK